MKKTSLSASFMCGMILLSFTACGSTGAGENTSVSDSALTTVEAVTDSVTENSEEASASEQEKSEEITPKISMVEGSPLFIFDTVFAYPFGTSNDDKTDSIELTEGSKWGDFTVTKAESTYRDGQDSFDALASQYLWLKGDISFECKAYRDWDGTEDSIHTDYIVLEMPEELYKQLPSLTPYSEFEGGWDCTRFLSYPENGELGKKLDEALKTAEEVNVSVSANEIKLQYTYFGLVTDGGTCGFLENVTDFEIK